MSTEDTAARLVHLKAKVAEVERLRMQEDARRQAAEERLVEIDEKIRAMGVEPGDAEKTLTDLDRQLAEELTVIEAALAEEMAAYRQLTGK